LQEAAIILAAGQGSRYDLETPKQFAYLRDLPLLWHSVATFHAFNPQMSIFLILNEKDIERWNKLVMVNELKVNHNLVIGGQTRSESVKNALEKLNGYDLVYVHDAARPCINVDFLKRLKSSAENHGNAIPVIPNVEMEDTAFMDGSKTVEYDEVYSVQTPQVFKAIQLQAAYHSNYFERAKDDSEILERAGYALHYVSGLTENIKLTFPYQKEIVERHLQSPK